MRRQIDKAVFPVAGLGTRFLPATKASPKEMLPVVDKPLIQYAVEEAAEAGIKTLIFITGRTKRAIEDHFDKVYELETELKERGKSALLKVVEDTAPKGINCVFIRQREALGLGHAVLSARPVVGEHPFAVILADDLIDGQSCGVMKQMIEQFQRYQCSMLGVERIPQEDTQKYGIVKTLPFNKQLSNLDGIVEKPIPSEAPSNLAVVGRYILTPRIFELLDKTSVGAGGEIQLTDAIAELLKEEQVLAYEFAGARFDCGSKLGYLKANLEFGLMHPELGPEFKKCLEEVAGRLASTDACPSTD